MVAEQKTSSQLVTDEAVYRREEHDEEMQKMFFETASQGTPEDLEKLLERTGATVSIDLLRAYYLLDMNCIELNNREKYEKYYGNTNIKCYAHYRSAHGCDNFGLLIKHRKEQGFKIKGIISVVDVQEMIEHDNLIGSKRRGYFWLPERVSETTKILLKEHMIENIDAAFIIIRSLKYSYHNTLLHIACWEVSDDSLIEAMLACPDIKSVYTKNTDKQTPLDCALKIDPCIPTCIPLGYTEDKKRVTKLKLEKIFKAGVIPTQENIACIQEKFPLDKELYQMAINNCQEKRKLVIYRKFRDALGEDKMKNIDLSNSVYPIIVSYMLFTKGRS